MTIILIISVIFIMIYWLLSSKNKSTKYIIVFIIVLNMAISLIIFKKYQKTRNVLNMVSYTTYKQYCMNMANFNVGGNMEIDQHSSFNKEMDTIISLNKKLEYVFEETSPPFYFVPESTDELFNELIESIKSIDIRIKVEGEIDQHLIQTISNSFNKIGVILAESRRTIKNNMFGINVIKISYSEDKINTIRELLEEVNDSI